MWSHALLEKPNFQENHCAGLNNFEPHLPSAVAHPILLPQHGRGPNWGTAELSWRLWAVAFTVDEGRPFQVVLQEVVEWAASYY